ncbi:hypothetical protein GCM10011385_22250 [Nitratireductor aestuarii]|uniref:Uncharacterized protein n=1 Tax=Nitratireductor aestuarii TaxID=1735103 RepID=A0A916RSC1_9HYPH|nr:hypothetical protein [Nitratireductor aestuarii]GGA67903.1 hypothetical protein GCM10011385_22250 [Nitratireductor aestuarii]
MSAVNKQVILRERPTDKVRNKHFAIIEFGEAFATHSRSISDGCLVSREDIVHGLENAPAVLQRLFVGANIGKRLVRVGGEGGAFSDAPER